MPAKICPRCGAQYENLRSTTCPQCFAKLLIIDQSTAEELTAARAQVEQTPEFQEAKANDDEQFREQSFGACLGIAAIVLLTVITVIVLLVHAMHHQHHPASASVPASDSLASVKTLTALPVAAASIEDVLPLTLAGFHRVNDDQEVNIPGTLTRIFHAQYTAGTNTLNVYAIPADRPTPELNTFQLGLALASLTGRKGKHGSTDFFATEHWRYAVAGDSSRTLAFFRAQLIAQFVIQEQ